MIRTRPRTNYPSQPRRHKRTTKNIQRARRKKNHLFIKQQCLRNKRRTQRNRRTLIRTSNNLLKNKSTMRTPSKKIQRQQFHNRQHKIRNSLRLFPKTKTRRNNKHINRPSNKRKRNHSKRRRPKKTQHTHRRHNRPIPQPTNNSKRTNLWRSFQLWR
jgi:hypothetical protein